MVNVLVNGVKVQFRIDTGADVTVIPKDIFKLLDGINIMPSTHILTGLQCDPLNAEEKFIAKLETEDRYSNQDTYVVKNVSQPLLGWPAMRALNILTNVNTIFYDEDSIKALF